LLSAPAPFPADAVCRGTGHSPASKTRTVAPWPPRVLPPTRHPTLAPTVFSHSRKHCRSLKIPQVFWSVVIAIPLRTLDNSCSVSGVSCGWARAAFGPGESSFDRNEPQAEGARGRSWTKGGRTLTRGYSVPSLIDRPETSRIGSDHGGRGWHGAQGPTTLDTWQPRLSVFLCTRSARGLQAGVAKDSEIAPQNSERILILAVSFQNFSAHINVRATNEGEAKGTVKETRRRGSSGISLPVCSVRTPRASTASH